MATPRTELSLQAVGLVVKMPFEMPTLHTEVPGSWYPGRRHRLNCQLLPGSVLAMAGIWRMRPHMGGCSPWLIPNKKSRIHSAFYEEPKRENQFPHTDIKAKCGNTSYPDLIIPHYTWVIIVSYPINLYAPDPRSIGQEHGVLAGEAGDGNTPSAAAPDILYNLVHDKSASPGLSLLCVEATCGNRSTYRLPMGWSSALVCAWGTWATRGHQSTLGGREAHRPSCCQNMQPVLCQ